MFATLVRAGSFKLLIDGSGDFLLCFMFLGAKSNQGS